jgi:hypothetical protein
MARRDPSTYKDLLNVDRTTDGLRADVLLKTLLRGVKKHYMSDFDSLTSYSDFKRMHDPRLLLSLTSTFIGKIISAYPKLSVHTTAH